MKSTTANFRFEFVEKAPRELSENVLYISIPYGMALHLCPCGCGSEVANKISPARWTLIYDGETVSLEPSVRNSGIPCHSHYFITRNKIEWAFDSFEESSEKTKNRKKKFKFFWQK